MWQLIHKAGMLITSFLLQIAILAQMTVHNGSYVPEAVPEAWIVVEWILKSQDRSEVYSFGGRHNRLKSIQLVDGKFEQRKKKKKETHIWITRPWCLLIGQ